MWTFLLSLACTDFAPTNAASASRITAPPPRVVNLGAAAAGDLDGDGDIDLVTTAAQPLYNDGAGQFTAGAIAWTGADGGALTWYGAVVAVATSAATGSVTWAPAKSCTFRVMTGGTRPIPACGCLASGSRAAARAG